MTIYSWSQLQNTPGSSIVTAAAMDVYEKIAVMTRSCEFQAITEATKPLAGEQYLKADPTEVEPWRATMLNNTPGQAPAGAPVFLAQGTADTTVRPEITKQFGEASVQARHAGELRRAAGRHAHFRRQGQRAAQALTWMGDRFRGAPAPSSCGRSQARGSEHGSTPRWKDQKRMKRTRKRTNRILRGGRAACESRITEKPGDHRDQQANKSPFQQSYCVPLFKRAASAKPLLQYAIRRAVPNATERCGRPPRS